LLPLLFSTLLNEKENEAAEGTFFHLILEKIEKKPDFGT
tara:strand:- start:294 stop:410 length:117 start_codon:yes stop_codon:yes gene_type:complete